MTPARLARTSVLNRPYERTRHAHQHRSHRQCHWRGIAERHALRYPNIDDAASWAHADFVWGAGSDIVSSMNKARLTGFTLLEDSEDQFIRHLEPYRTLKGLP